MDNLAFRTAKKHVTNYRLESDVMAEHYKAMNCRDCEAFLKLGIDAFAWVTYADAVVRSAAYEGAIELDPTFDHAIEVLCEGWLKPCEKAEQWIADLREHGYVPDNLEQFRQCCREMEAIVRFHQNLDSESLPDSMVALRNQALDDHRNGQSETFECVEGRE